MTLNNNIPYISLVNTSLLSKQYEILENNTFLIPYPCEKSNICSPYRLIFRAGSYHVELFGAEGGSAFSNKTQTTMKGGKGGYVSALLSFPRVTEAFLYIGGRGHDYETGEKSGGFNGGGDTWMHRGSGGGATDIRLFMDSYESRILVAGGGGGGFANNVIGDAHGIGGNGGGLDGELGNQSDDESCYPCIGSQNSCYTPTGICSPEFYDNGTFGVGSSKQYGSGGGGWWGGGSANGWGSSGGSSYYGNLPYGETKSGVREGNGYALIKTIVLFESNTCVTKIKLKLKVFIYILLIYKYK